jgi:hypothetical protein
VFDEAPFMSAAVNQAAYEAAQNYVTANSTGIYNETFFQYTFQDYPLRKGNVTDYYVSGEILQPLRATGFGIGDQKGRDFGWSLLSGFETLTPMDLHSQALMVTGEISPAFREATAQMGNFLPAAFDDKLYAINPAISDNRDFLRGLIISEQSAPGTGKLTRIAQDLQAIGGYLQTHDDLSSKARDGLVAQLVEWYYWQDAGNQELFLKNNPLGSGVFQYSTALGDKFAGAENRADIWTQTWLAPIFAGFGSALSQAKAADQWTVVATDFTWSTARDTGKTQLFIGGSGSDDFTGGELDDVLFGGDGIDTLRGLGGNDILIGGKGRDELYGGWGGDTYRYQPGDGQTIIDDDHRVITWGGSGGTVPVAPPFGYGSDAGGGVEAGAGYPC